MTACLVIVGVFLTIGCIDCHNCTGKWPWSKRFSSKHVETDFEADLLMHAAMSEVDELTPSVPRLTAKTSWTYEEAAAEFRARYGREL
jgi:hypothetical protein